MDKYVELLCKQNPKMTLECRNPDCGYKASVDSKDVFKNNEYKHLCPECNKVTSYDSSKFADDFKKQLKNLGISLN